jgi:phage tail-like protein
MSAGLDKLDLLALRFTLEVLGTTLGTFGSMRGLHASFEVLEYREGGVNSMVHRLPGQVVYPNLVLSGGGSTPALHDWFRATLQGGQRHDVTLTLTNNEGGRRAWSFEQAFPVAWTGPSFDAVSGRLGSESLELAHAGFKEL